LTVPVKNSGDRDGDEVVQVYQHRKGSPPTEPIRSLVAFQRVTVAKGNTTDVSLDIPLDRFRYWSAEKGAYVIQNGIYDLQIGSSSDDIRQMFEITLQP
jgi:beta-glucosidase